MSLESQDSPASSFHDGIMEEMESPVSSYDECSCETCNNPDGSEPEDDEYEDKGEYSFTQLKRFSTEKVKNEEITNMDSPQQLLSSSMPQTDLEGALPIHPVNPISVTLKKHRQCSFCKIHGFSVSIRGHKSFCQFREACFCKGCELIRCNQEVSKNQVKLRRQKDMETELIQMDSGSIEPRSISSDPLKRIPMCFKCWLHDSVRVRLKGHRTVCPYVRCGCANCGLNRDRKRLTRELREVMSSESDKIKYQRKISSAMPSHSNSLMNTVGYSKPCLWYKTLVPSYNTNAAFRLPATVTEMSQPLSFSTQASSPINLSQGIHQQARSKWLASEMVPAVTAHTFYSAARNGNNNAFSSNIQNTFASSSCSGTNCDRSGCYPEWIQVPSSWKSLPLQTSYDASFLTPATLDITRDTQNNSRNTASFPHFSAVQVQPQSQCQSQVKDRAPHLLLSKDVVDGDAAGLSDANYKSLTSSHAFC